MGEVTEDAGATAAATWTAPSAVMLLGISRRLMEVLNTFENAASS